MTELTGDLPNEVTVTGKNVGNRKVVEGFVDRVIELASKGYKRHPNPKKLKQVTSFQGHPRVTMVSEAYLEELLTPVKVVEVVDEVVLEEVTTEAPVSYEEAIEGLSKKGDLISLAEELGIDIPEDKKAPKAIKQFMLNSIKNK